MKTANPFEECFTLESESLPINSKKQKKEKKSRKQKKQQEHILLQEFMRDNLTNNEYPQQQHSSGHQNSIGHISNKVQERKVYKPYESIRYMSEREKQIFEQKFTPPRTITQEQYAKMLNNQQKKIIVVNGPAGTGKTMFATEFGVRYFLTDVYEKLIFTRPSVAVDEDLGYLPGTLEEKMAPWIRPIYDVLLQFLSTKEIQTLMEEKIIEIAPLGFMRGRTFKNTWIVADEMQNSTISQMKMLLTRIGENSRLIITGDLEQHDKPYELNGLEDFLRKFKGKR